MTRTQRTIIRGHWDNEYTVHQISEYMKLTPKAVRLAIENSSGDNLNEDEGYRDGRHGDVIIVEDTQSDADVVEEVKIKTEESEVEKKLDCVAVNFKSGSKWFHEYPHVLTLRTHHYRYLCI